MIHSWPELLHKSRSPGSWCQISGRLSYLGCEDIAICVGRTLIDLGLIGQSNGIFCTRGLPAYGVLETTGRNACLSEGMYDGNCLSHSSERITIWVRVKGKLAEGSPSHDSANCAPCRSSTMQTYGGTAMDNPSRKRKCHVISGLRIPKILRR